MHPNNCWSTCLPIVLSVPPTACPSLFSNSHLLPPLPPHSSLPSLPPHPPFSPSCRDFAYLTPSLPPSLVQTLSPPPPHLSSLVSTGARSPPLPSWDVLLLRWSLLPWRHRQQRRGAAVEERQRRSAGGVEGGRLRAPKAPNRRGFVGGGAAVRNRASKTLNR